jgi:hypothetical protein
MPVDDVHAGVVHQNVQAVECLRDIGANATHLILVGQVGWLHVCLAGGIVDAAGYVIQLFARAAGQNDGRAILGERHERRPRQCRCRHR